MCYLLLLFNELSRQVCEENIGDDNGDDANCSNDDDDDQTTAMMPRERPPT